MPGPPFSWQAHHPTVKCEATVYANEQFNFQFPLSSDLLVCEERGDDELATITLWNKNDFHSRAPRIGPIATINIHKVGVPTILDQLPPPIVLKQEERMIGGVPGTRKEVQSSLCTHSGCPTGRMYECMTGGYSFTIEEIGARDFVVESLTFGSANNLAQ